MKLTRDTFEAFRAGLLRQREDISGIKVCCGTGCLARGGREVAEALRTAMDEAGLDPKRVELTRTGCHGWCEMGPIVTIEPSGTFYQKVTSAHATDIVAGFEKQAPVQRLLFRDSATRQTYATYHEIPFYKGQTRWALRNVGRVDPSSIRDCMGRDGYVALHKALTTMTPEEVLDEVSKARLRGRGGGGFDAGRKWRSCRKAAGTPKYILCNGDEGDPGAFMDRTIMEGDPHGVIEGMILAAYAVGSSEGYVYVRQEYPLAVEHLRRAMEDARSYGLMGDNILGTDFCFDLHISRGGGAFVCGESSALMRSIEGKAGEPRAKYVHATDKGLYDKPTVLNNVETFVNVPLIIQHSANWFTALGTEKSTGTKAFSVVGKVRYNGLVEVPMGTSIRHLIFDIAGGIPRDKPFKAVQTGGPSGGCLPEDKLDLPVDFDSLTRAGSMMGSGGLIVMDNRNCMVDVARYFIAFLVEESCGKCVCCREGLKQLSWILEGICQGTGTMEDMERIERLCTTLEEGSLCALGKSASNPVRSTLQYFRHEYEEHIRDGFCRAGVCRNLCSYEITSECTGCTLCARVCPPNCVQGERKGQHLIDTTACIRCGSCYDVCNFNAVSIRSSR